MAELTLEEALKIFEQFKKIDANGRARDEKGRFIAEKQLDAARELIAKDLESFKGTTGSFKKLIGIQNKTKEALEVQLEKQTQTLKAERAKGNEAQKKLEDLQKKSEEERDSDHDEQVENQKTIIAESKKATKLAEDQVRSRKEQINPLLKENRLLKERKAELNKMGKELEEQGQDKNENKAFRKEQKAIQLEEIELRKQGDIPLSKRIELEKEKAKAQSESDNILQKGFGALKLGIMNLSEKFGAGAMAVGKSLLALFGLGLLIKFLESDVFKRIREFIAGPSLDSFVNIFAPDGELDMTFIAITGAVTGLLGFLLLKFTGLSKLITKPFGLLFKAIPTLIRGLGSAITKTFDLAKKGLGKTGKGFSKVGDVASKTKGFFGRGLAAAKNIGSAALEKGTQLAKQTVQVGTKIGKDAASGAKAVLPKIAGASRAGLKAAGAAGKFIPGAGLIIGASVAAVEGVASGVQEFKESGDAGRAIAEGFGGALSSLSFGLVDKEKFADFFKKEEELTSDQLAQAMAGGPSVGPAQFASLAGGSDAARLRELENELQEGGMSDRARRNRLSQMKSLEAKMARERAGGGNVTNIVDNSTNSSSNATNNTHVSTDIVDRELDFLASPAI